MKRELLLVGLGLASTTVFAADINLGPADIMAADQARVIFALTYPGTDTDVNPQIVDNMGLLDTGANGIMLSAGAYAASGSHAPYTPALRSDGTPVVYTETGVSGSDALTVYQPYDIQYAGLTGAPVQMVQSVNVFGSPNIDLGFPAVIGMPAMRGRVVQMDPKPLTYTSVDFVQTQFYAAPPVSNTAKSYNISLPMLPFEHTGSDPLFPSDPKPTFADLPQVDVTVAAKGVTVTQRLLLDTGAQVSIISMRAALAMGINMTDAANGGDVLDHLAVGGVGGQVLMPIVRLERISIPTQEGDVLYMTDLELGVLDITGIDGVLGMNILTSGYTGHLAEGSGAYGAFSEITLDFTKPEAGVMRLDINPAYLVPEPTCLAFIGVFSLLLTRRRAG